MLLFFGSNSEIIPYYLHKYGLGFINLGVANNSTKKSSMTIPFKKKLLSTVLIVFMCFLYAQSSESVEKKIEEAVNFSSENPAQAISLFKEALVESEKIKFDKGILKCKSSLAILYFNGGEYEKVIEISDDVEKLANRLKNFSNLTGIYRTVSASYSLLGLNDQAIENLDKALKYSKYIEDKNIKHYRVGLIYDSYSACIDDMKGDPDLILSYINKSIQELNQIPDEGTREDIVNAKYNVLGIQYVKLGKQYSENYIDPIKAEEHYLRALEIYENPKFQIESTNKIALFANVSDFYLGLNDFEKSIRYGEEGLKFTNKSEQPELRKQLYNTLFKSYLQIGQKEKSNDYADLYTKLNDSIRKTERSGVNTSVEKIVNQKISEHKTKQKQILMFSGLIIVLLLVTFFIYWKMKSKNVRKKYETLIAKIKKEEINSNAILNNGKVNDSKTSLNITDETAERLLQKLEKFELSEKYLRNEINLTWLANHLNTNTRYLSEIINIHRGKTFANYINGLRINYVIHKLVEDPIYREYKINYLAKECGYASRQVFVIAFKNETGFTPSYFIENLKSEKSLNS